MVAAHYRVGCLAQNHSVQLCHEAAKPLEDLVAEWPKLRDFMKALQPQYIFVRRYIRSIPRSTDGKYRLDVS